MPELRLEVKGVSANTHYCFKNVAAHTGITLSKVLLPKISEIVKKYNHVLSSPTCERSCKFVIKGISEKMQQQLKQIAASLGVDTSDLIKIELQKELEEYPEYMKVPMLD